MEKYTLAYFLLVLLCGSNAIDLLGYHKRAFEKGFHDRCDKYPFVHQYVKKMENTDQRYLTFVYQQNGLKNGGLGDKIGGLVSAVAMALRFNRTLIVRSENEMHEVFRPYHPTDIHNKVPKYTWDNFTSWSDFDWKYANQDATKYDLYDCINNTGQKNSHCSMKDGDAGTPHILYRSNRAYLCYYDKQKGSVANEQMNTILGVNETSNLYEVAGCMLRLALWPTEQLWATVGKQLTEFESTLGGDSAGKQSARRRLRETRHLGEREKVVRRTASPAPSQHKVVQVGLHFRCGDKSYLKKGGYDHMCVYNEDDSEENKKAAFPWGNPYEMGMCAYRALHTHLIAALLDPADNKKALTSATTIETTETTETTETAATAGSQESAPAAVVRRLNEKDTTLSAISNAHTLSMAFLASDNEMASMQMNMTLGLPHSIVSPQGCHVELDISKQCHMFTVSQWFILSLSDLMVTQEGIPSSFSRYAGIYGLKPDPFRNGKNCDVIETTMELSRKAMSNWFC